MKLPKRFYKEVTVPADNTIRLDGRIIKTPGRRTLALPTKALAEAIAEEWRGQGAHVDPATMPLTKLANTAIDRVGPDRARIIPDRARIIAEIVEFAGTDLVCYRAEGPAGLVDSESRHWDPVIAWALKSLDATLVVTAGVVHRKQPDQALNAMQNYISALDPFTLTALHNMMTLTGSALLAAMTLARGITPESAWAAAHVDGDFQIEQWGADEEAAQRRQRRQDEFMACARFSELAK